MWLCKGMVRFIPSCEFAAILCTAITPGASPTERNCFLGSSLMPGMFSRSDCLSIGLTIINRSCRGWRPHCKHAPATRTALNRIAPVIESALWLAYCLEPLLTQERITLLDHLYLYIYVHTQFCSKTLAPDGVLRAIASRHEAVR